MLKNVTFFISLILLSSLPVWGTANPLFDPNEFYIAIQRIVPSPAVSNGSWNTTWGAGKNLLNPISPTVYRPEKEVLEEFGLSFGRTFRNANELFGFLRSLENPENVAEVEKATGLTSELFGRSSVATHEQMSARTIMAAMNSRKTNPLAREFIALYRKNLGPTRFWNLVDESKALVARDAIPALRCVRLMSQ